MDTGEKLQRLVGMVVDIPQYTLILVLSLLGSSVTILGCPELCKAGNDTELVKVFVGIFQLFVLNM